MAIKGSLGEASLGDVCQLLSLGHKTGGLSITDRSRFGQIFFRRGRIVFAHVVNRRDRLGDLLVRDGVLDAAALAGVLDEQARSPRRRLGELLLERELIDAATLARYVRRQIEDAIYHLCTWTRGSFFFEPDDAPEAADVEVSLNPDMLLLEAARRIDEWSVIEGKIASLEVVFEVEREWLRAADVELTAEQQQIVPLIDGQRSVRQLAEQTGLGEFDAARAVYGLIEAGYAHRVGEHAPPPVIRSVTAELTERRNLATAFFRARMLAEARQEFEAVLALRADDRSARFHLGLIAMHERQFSAAASAFREVLDRGGPHFAAFIGLADALRAQARHRDALLVLGEAEALRPGRPEVALARAMNHLALRELPAARAAFAEHEQRLDAGSVAAAPCFYFAALAAALAGALDDAAATTERGVQAHPESAPLLLMTGLLAERNGDHERAGAWYARAVEADPACAHAHRNLGEVCERAGRPRDALAHYRRAVEADADAGSDLHARIGNLLYGSGDFAGAVRHWNRALELNPADNAVRNHLLIMSNAAG